MYVEINRNINSPEKGFVPETYAECPEDGKKLLLLRQERLIC